MRIIKFIPYNNNSIYSNQLTVHSRLTNRKVRFLIFHYRRKYNIEIDVDRLPEFKLIEFKLM